MAKNKTTLEVNTNSDTSKSVKKEATEMLDGSYMTETEEGNTVTADKDSVLNTDSNKTIDADSSKTVVDNNDSNASSTDKNTKGKSSKGSIAEYNARLTQEQRVEAARRAGIASGQARRERKTLGEELKAILSDGDNQERLCMALFKSALTGNYKAFNSLRDTIGEMPTQKQEVTANITEGDRELLENVKKRLNITE